VCTFPHAANLYEGKSAQASGAETVNIPDMNGQIEASLPYMINRDQAPTYWEVDILWLLLADGKQTGGAFSLLEQLCPKGSGPPPHTHTQIENFYIMEGEITFLIDGQTVVGKEGSFVTVPAGTVHSFRIDSETALILNSYIPAGFELMITELGEVAPERNLPPRGRPFQHSPEEIARTVERSGMQWLDLPDTLRQSADSRMRVTTQRSQTGDAKGQKEVK
jgi:quercetin dioxygenase-like cupin family protein